MAGRERPSVADVAEHRAEAPRATDEDLLKSGLKEGFVSLLPFSGLHISPLERRDGKLEVLTTNFVRVTFSAGERHYLEAPSPWCPCRSLATFRLAGLHSLLGAVYAAGRAVGLGRCPVGGGKWRIGVIDGSCFGRFMASCFAEIGLVCLMGGLEAIPKFGKELPSSQRLLRRLLARFGPRWVDLLLLDGLYVAQGFLRVCLEECYVDFLIKTQEAGLDIIQDAMGLFRNYRAYAHDIEYVQGTDAQRMVSYRVYALGGFFLEGVKAPIKVAWVQEEDLRSGKQVEFWVLTSLEELTAGQMRELAHWRWDIENNGFKSFNSLVHTKHIYSHDLHAAEAMALILLIAGTVLQLFLSHVGREELEVLFGKVKLTRVFLQRQLRASVEALPAPDT